MRMALITTLLLGFSAPAAAQDFTQPGQTARPVDGGCISLAVVDVTPGDAEWTWFVGGGGGARSLGRAEERGVGMVRLVGEVTVPLMNIGGGYGGPAHLRAGPYVSAETSFEGGLGEGGLSLTIGQVQHARWGTFGIRLGGGLGGVVDQNGQLQRTAFVSGTFSWGVLSVPGRYRNERGACDPVRTGPEHLFSSGFRIFATGRAPLRESDGYSLVIGVEIEPGFLFGPFSIERLIGAR